MRNLKGNFKIIFAIVVVVLLLIDIYLNNQPGSILPSFSKAKEEPIAVTTTQAPTESTESTTTAASGITFDFDAIFKQNKRVFPESNDRLLTQEEVDALAAVEKYGQSYQKTLRIAINEIYAAMGQDYSGTSYENRFADQDWYKKVEKKKITDDDFNEFEARNIALLLKKEKELKKDTESK
ncbi:hypothetical protein P261_01656 [Lachnospiraceae bacterium TWA4]|nr:hypothetical protein P261_01656 [Lachnospiraceae bacterium TWA4]